MKTRFLIVIAICVFCFGNVGSRKVLAYSIPKSEDSIRVYCSPDLHKLTSTWVENFHRIDQGAKIKVFEIQEVQGDIVLNSSENLYFLSEEYYLKQKNRAAFAMIIGVDALVPIFSSKNPSFDDINLKGVSSERMEKAFQNQANCNWGALLGSTSNNSVNLYFINDEFTKTEVVKYLNIEASKIVRFNEESEEELISAIQKDPYAIGFCKIADVVDSKTNSVIQGVSFLPIDRNNNGRIDNTERIYSDLNTFLRGVWIGKYPKELCNNIYSISSIKPTSESAVSFLTWVITDGQQYLNEHGFSGLASNVIKTNIDKLYVSDDIEQTSKSWSVIPLAAIVLMLCLALFFIVDFIVQRMKGARSLVHEVVIDSSPFFDDSSIVVPDGLYFDKSHTWAYMEKDGVVGIGIDDFLQSITGPITKVKMKEAGEKVKKGDPFLTLIQDGKQLIIKSPLSGTIKAQNKVLISNSSLINKSPYSDGWIYKIEPTNWMRDIQFLIFAQGYKEWLKMEFMHLKDFFAIAVRPALADKTQIVLQDGGVIRKGILKDLKPEVWEDFQTHFLDSPK